MTTHGLSHKKEYSIWQNMKERCYNKKSTGYKNWGGRGITVHKEWIGDFEAFYNYITSLPDYGEECYTLDRIDNDCGYEPGNLRWADRHTQLTNKRGKPNKTGYAGVAKNNVGYFARVSYKGKTTYIGNFRTPEIANAVRVDYLIENELHEYLT